MKVVCIDGDGSLLSHVVHIRCFELFLGAVDANCFVQNGEVEFVCK